MTPVKQPRVLITILDWNNNEETLECLASLKKQDHTNFDVVVIDNGSDPALEISDKTVRLIRNPRNLGFGAGHNQALKVGGLANYDYWMPLNNDAVLQPNTLTRLVDDMENNPRAAGVSPTVINDLPGKPLWYAGGTINLKRGEGWHNGVPKPRGFGGTKPVLLKDLKTKELSKTEFLTGACVLLRLSVIKEVGTFDENYFVYWEDTDLSVRLAAAGFDLLYDPKALLIHHVSQTLGMNSPRYLYYVFRNNLLFVKKYVNWPWKLLAWGVMFKKLSKELVKIFWRYRKDHFKYLRLITRAFWDHWVKRYGSV